MPESTALLWIEFELSFVIKRCAVRQAAATRRLNAIENTIAALAHEWRPFRPIEPKRELRLAPHTCAALTNWVRARETGDGDVAARLAMYESETVSDVTVPAGWVRLLLDRV